MLTGEWLATMPIHPLIMFVHFAEREHMLRVNNEN